MSSAPQAQSRVTAPSAEQHSCPGAGSGCPGDGGTLKRAQEASPLSCAPHACASAPRVVVPPGAPSSSSSTMRSSGDNASAHVLAISGRVEWLKQ
ncbi:hypothetical protein EJB05_42279, partial [Eragrostis curvula]